MVLDKSSSQIDPRFISRRHQFALLGSRRPCSEPLRGRDRAVLKLLLKLTRHQKTIAVAHLRGQALVNLDNRVAHEPARNALRKTILRQSGSGRGGSAEEGLGVRFRGLYGRVSRHISSAVIIHLCPQLKITFSRIDSCGCCWAVCPT